jgi:uncharacterized repeat protein (TIGR02543 family)
MIMRKNTLKNIYRFIASVLILIFFSGTVHIEAFGASGGNENILWDDAFSGAGAAEITFRSYLYFEVYDEDTGEFLGTVHMDKQSGGSSIDGTYVLKYNGEALLYYRNDGNNCRLTAGNPNAFRFDFYQYLYNNPQKSIRGREHYIVKAVSTVLVYARDNHVGPYNGSGWKTESDIERLDREGWKVDTSSKSGGKGDGHYLSGDIYLSSSQQANIRSIITNGWTERFTPEGSSCKVTYDANGGKVKKFPSYIDTVKAYEGVCISDIPIREGYYFWGWSRTKFTAGKGPSDYFDMYHEGDTLYDVWERTTLYAVWGTTPFGGDHSPAHVHTFVKKQNYTGTNCPICGERLYFWGLTCSSCGEYERGENVPHTCPDAQLIYVSGECRVCEMGGVNHGSTIRTGDVQRILALNETTVTHTGHKFLGWNTEPSGTGTWYSPGDYINVKTYGQNVYIFAIWEPMNYTLHLDYHEDSFIDPYKMITGDDTINVTYDTFMDDLPEPTMEGFSFLGWYSPDKGVMVNEYQRYALAFDAVFSAEWGGHGIEITTDPAFPAMSKNRKEHPYFIMLDNTFPMDYGTRYSGWIPIMYAPSCDGYDFTGWTVNGEKIEDDTICETDMDHVIYGSWRLKDVKLTLDPGLGHFEGQDEGEKKEKIVTYGSDLTGINALPTPVREGYMFDGWYEKADFSEGKVEDKMYVPDDAVVFAKWIPRKYIVEFDYSEHWKYDAKDLKYNDMKNAIVTYGEIPKLPEPERYGYRFVGWAEGFIYDDEHDATNGDEEALIPTNIPWSITHNLKAYAIWKPLHVKVTYDYNYDYTEEIPLP